YLKLVFRLVTEMPLVARLTSGDRDLELALSDINPQVRGNMEDLQVALMGAMLADIPRAGGWPEDLLEELSRALLAVAYASSSLMGAHRQAGMSPAKLGQVLAQLLVKGIMS